MLSPFDLPVPFSGVSLMSLLAFYLIGSYYIMPLQSVPYNLPKHLNESVAHSVNGNRTVPVRTSHYGNRPEPFNSVSPTTIESMDSHLFQQITKNLSPKDTVLLASASKSLHSVAQTSVRILYVQHFPNVSYVSPVTWYHFCVDYHRELIPRHFSEISACFTDVESNYDELDWPSYRLQFIYGLIGMKSNYLTIKERQYFASQILDRKPGLHDQQLTSLMYFVTERVNRDNQTMTWHEILFTKLCLNRSKFPRDWTLFDSCQASVGMLFDQAYKKLLQNMARYRSAEIEEKTLRVANVSENLCNTQFRTGSSIPTRDIVSRNMNYYLYFGANIHLPCFSKMLESYLQEWHHYSRGDAETVLDAQAFMIDFAISRGFSVQDNSKFLFSLVQDSLIEEFLAAGASVFAVNAAGFSPLYVACKQNLQTKVRLLLDFGADPNYSGTTEASLLSVSSDVEINAMLLERGAQVNYEDKEGNTPLFSAIRGIDNFDLVKLFVDRGANIVHTNRRNQTVLMLGRNLKSVEYVLQFPGSNVLLDVQDSNGDTALNYGAANLFLGLEKCAMLIDAGADINLANHDGINPLLQSVMIYFPGFAELFLETGKADPNHQDVNGQSPLMYATLNREPKVVALLLEYGARINMARNDGESALSMARDMAQRFPSSCDAREVLAVLDGSL